MSIVEIEFTWDGRDLEVFRGGGVERALANVLSKAGGDAARAMRTEAGRKVRERKQMKAGVVRKALPLTFPTSKEITRLAWRMDVSGAMVPVSAFPHRQTRKGVSVQINRSSRSLIRSAFVAVMPSGHKGVFIRHGRARLPIKEAFTTRVSDVFGDGGFIPTVQARAQRVFGAAVVRLMPLELGKLKGSR